MGSVGEKTTNETLHYVVMQCLTDSPPRVLSCLGLNYRTERFICGDR